jgi:hypothetical protein
MKNIPRDANQATQKGERILIDISWVSEGIKVIGYGCVYSLFMVIFLTVKRLRYGSAYATATPINYITRS